jgi:excisionase family DNA binding protein
MPKTSVLAGSGKRGMRRRTWLSLAQVARLQDCSERTVREWCKKGEIPEAYQTAGGHWRIRLPLSGKTIAMLHRRSRDWPFEKGKGDMQGEWAPDVAERLMIAEWYQRCLDQGISMPPITELEDPFTEEVIEPSTDPIVLKAREIHDQIMQRIQNKKYISDLSLRGWVCDFWRKNQRPPTVAGIAQGMGLSKTAWYRRYKRKDLYQAWRDVCGRVEPDLADVSGLNSAQRQSQEAKKPGLAKLKRQLDHYG